MVLLPPPNGHLATVVARLPAPMFAALAILTLTSPSGQLPTLPALIAVLGALLGARWRSLFLTLFAGLAGYLAATALFA